MPPRSAGRRGVWCRARAFLIYIESARANSRRPRPLALQRWLVRATPACSHVLHSVRNIVAPADCSNRSRAPRLVGARRRSARRRSSTRSRPRGHRRATTRLAIARLAIDSAREEVEQPERSPLEIGAPHRHFARRNTDTDHVLNNYLSHTPCSNRCCRPAAFASEPCAVLRAGSYAPRSGDEPFRYRRESTLFWGAASRIDDRMRQQD
jgi:hypothetical protein